MDRNQPQAPRRPRNEGVSGSSPLVGSSRVTGAEGGPRQAVRCVSASRRAPRLASHGARPPDAPRDLLGSSGPRC